MNDPVFVECARGFAERMQQEGGSTPNEQIAWALQLATTGPADARAVASLVGLYQDAHAEYNAADTAMQWLGTDAESYARTVVASAVLNLDDVITR